MRLQCSLFVSFGSSSAALQCRTGRRSCPHLNSSTIIFVKGENARKGKNAPHYHCGTIVFCAPKPNGHAECKITNLFQLLVEEWTKERNEQSQETCTGAYAGRSNVIGVVAVPFATVSHGTHNCATITSCFFILLYRNLHTLCRARHGYLLRASTRLQLLWSFLCILSIHGMNERSNAKSESKGKGKKEKEIPFTSLNDLNSKRKWYARRMLMAPVHRCVACSKRLYLIVNFCFVFYFTFSVRLHSVAFLCADSPRRGRVNSSIIRFWLTSITSEECVERRSDRAKGC